MRTLHRIPRLRPPQHLHPSDGSGADRGPLALGRQPRLRPRGLRVAAVRLEEPRDVGHDPRLLLLAARRLRRAEVEGEPNVLLGQNVLCLTLVNSECQTETLINKIDRLYGLIFTPGLSHTEQQSLSR